MEAESFRWVTRGEGKLEHWQERRVKQRVVAGKCRCVPLDFASRFGHRWCLGHMT